MGPVKMCEFGGRAWPENLHLLEMNAFKTIKRSFFFFRFASFLPLLTFSFFLSLLPFFFSLCFNLFPPLTLLFDLS
jgi:hypothetical protein